MRVLIVTQYFWPENFRINDLVQELSARGHAVTVLTGAPNYPGGTVFPEFAEDPRKFGRLGVATVERVPMLPRGNGRLRLLLNYVSFALSASLLGAWRLRRAEFDVIFVFEPSPITVGLPAILLRRLKRAPLAFWVLDLWPESLGAIGVVKSARVLRAVGRLVSFIYARCDLILGQSMSFLSQIRRYCPEDKRVEFFPSWSDAGLGSASIAPAAEVPEAGGQFSVMFAGNIGEAQDFPAIIAAADAARHSAVRWLIVGDGRAAAWARKEVHSRDLDDKVVFLGQHPLERMPSFFKHADALLVTLRDEPTFSMTIPGKLQAYLAAGLPILGMLNGEGARVIEMARAGFVAPAGNGPKLAEHVVRLASMTDDERARMGARGIAYYRENFDRDTLISRLEIWLRELVASQRGNGTAGGTR